MKKLTPRNIRLIGTGVAIASIVAALLVWALVGTGTHSVRSTSEATTTTSTTLAPVPTTTTTAPATTTTLAPTTTVPVTPPTTVPTTPPVTRPTVTTTVPSHPAHWSGADAPIFLGMKDLTVVADGFVGCTVTYPVTSNQICYQKDFPKVHIYVTYSNGYTWYSTWTVGGSGWFEISDPEPSGVEPGMPAKGWPTDINCDILPGTAQAASADRIGYATACYVVPPGVL